MRLSGVVQVLSAKGPQSVQRGPKIVAAFGGADPSAAAAATAASNAAGEKLMDPWSLVKSKPSHIALHRPLFGF